MAMNLFKKLTIEATDFKLLKIQLQPSFDFTACEQALFTITTNFIQTVFLEQHLTTDT